LLTTVSGAHDTKKETSSNVADNSKHSDKRSNSNTDFLPIKPTNSKLGFNVFSSNFLD